jgi:hypothetical protein
MCDPDLALSLVCHATQQAMPRHSASVSSARDTHGLIGMGTAHALTTVVSFAGNAFPAQHISSNEIELESSRLRSALRVLSDLFDDAQARRIALGEKIRAVLQGRDPNWGWVDLPDCSTNACLKMIRDGALKKPVPVLSAAYHKAANDESDYRSQIEDVIRSHPTWHWLKDVTGAGASLSGRLLARLDLAKAATPSAFWSYCGLATVPGFGYACSVCGLAAAYPPGYFPTGLHRQLRGKRRCPGVLERLDGKKVRVAPRRSVRGQSATYDRSAKQICYLLGVSFLRCRSPYANYYRDQRDRHALKHPDWTDQRQHLSALRKTEKLFLAHLWCVWRAALGLPTINFVRPQDPQLEGLSDAWSMTTGKGRIV